MDEAGIMETGWIDLNGVWYYLYPDGHMASGESLISGNAYTFADSGAYQFDEIPPHTRDFSRELGGFSCNYQIRMVS